LATKAFKVHTVLLTESQLGERDLAWDPILLWKVASNMCYRSMDCEMNGHLIHAGFSRDLSITQVKYRTYNKACSWCQITDMMYTLVMHYKVSRLNRACAI
jgi:hypothetical protein